MASYLVLGNYTDEGIRNIKEYGTSRILPTGLRQSGKLSRLSVAG